MTDTAGTLFHVERSEIGKEVGMVLAAEARRICLDIAKDVAREIAGNRALREVTADDVQMALNTKYGWTPDVLGPSAGSLFKGKEWEFTGRRVRSCQTKNHGRELKVWRLVEQQEIGG